MSTVKGPLISLILTAADVHMVLDFSYESIVGYLKETSKDMHHCSSPVEDDSPATL